MKSILLPLLACLAALGSVMSTAGEPLKIVASFYPMYVTTLNVTTDVPEVSVTCLTEPFVGCLHDYQLRPADLKVLSKADIFVANGAGMENFLDKVIAQMPRLNVINASEGVVLLADDNPHVWVSVLGAIAQTRRIAARLAKADPAHAALYIRNAADYTAKLQALHDEMAAALKDVRSRDIITFHEAFPYLAAEFHLNVVGVVERVPGTEPNARELADTIRLVRSKKAAALFAEPQYSPRSAEVIARATGVKVSILDPVSTGPLDPEKARGHYLATMRANLVALKEALSR